MAAGAVRITAAVMWRADARMNGAGDMRPARRLAGKWVDARVNDLSENDSPLASLNAACLFPFGMGGRDVPVLMILHAAWDIAPNTG
jgi:hypothetical protein